MNLPKKERSVLERKFLLFLEKKLKIGIALFALLKDCLVINRTNTCIIFNLEKKKNSTFQNFIPF